MPCFSQFEEKLGATYLKVLLNFIRIINLLFFNVSGVCLQEIEKKERERERF